MACKEALLRPSMSGVFSGMLLAAACTLGVSCISPASAAEPFKKTLELQGFSFAIDATNEGSINHLKITPKRLTKDNTPVDVEIDGTVSARRSATSMPMDFPKFMSTSPRRETAATDYWWLTP